MTSILRHLSPLRVTVLAAALVVAMLLLPSLSGGAPATSQGLKAYFDPAEGKTPLDLFGVRFGQTASTDLTLLIRTQQPVDSDIIDPKLHRTLCILLRSDAVPNPEGRLCVYPNSATSTGLGIRYTPLDQQGVQLGIRDLTPTVVRPNDTTFRVTFPPALLRLKPGLYHWKARSQFVDSVDCPGPAGCEDNLPNKGEADMQITLSVSPTARQRCFGAASRDVRVPCRNPRLAREVVPKPAVAVTATNLPCSPLHAIGLIIPCEFGVPESDARNSIALIGDSHAAHWRSALEVVAQRFKWRGLSITRSGCPFTRATARLDPASRRAQCRRWNDEVPRWLAANPKVTTVFVVAHFDAGVVVRKGGDEFAVKMAGFRRAWQALPLSVKRVIVIRDTPKATRDTLSCVNRAIKRRKQAGPACARPRKAAISRDAAVVAAARMHSRRVKSVDLTSFFCSSRQCFPVIGGALVYKDVTHLTDVYSSSLGPYLLRKLRALDGR
jgi:hypothetical protein